MSDFKRNTAKNIWCVKEVSYLEFIQKKTSAPMSLPLHPTIMRIIKDGGREFPSAISIDNYIKKVCKLAGVEDEVQGANAEVIKMRRGKRMVNATRK